MKMIAASGEGELCKILSDVQMLSLNFKSACNLLLDLFWKLIWSTFFFFVRFLIVSNCLSFCSFFKFHNHYFV